MVTIIIPSRTEIFLRNTILDVLSNATGDIEVIPILDGYEPPADELVNDPRVKYLRIEDKGENQKRQGINEAVRVSKGEFVMALDAHCMVGKGFDEILAKDCPHSWVVIPRRYKLDPINWCVVKDNSIPVDYEYWTYDGYKKKNLKAYRWNERAIERKDIMIDDTLTMQASCWFMRKSWYLERGFMKVEGYTGWGQEDVEICLETWLNGGRVVVNKNTWYAHLFKGTKWGRMYHRGRLQYRRCVEYAFNHWCVERKEDFFNTMRKFKPIPNWKDL